jgi:tetratricopeptide (TPR) repeat protein
VSIYKKYLITASIILLSLSGCTNNIEAAIPNVKTQEKTFDVKSKSFDLENEYIIFALEYENIRDYNKARSVYFKLFKETNKYEYFVKYLTLSFHVKDYNAVRDNAVKYLVEDIKEEELILRMHTFALIKLKENKEALAIAKKLSSKFPNAENIELLGSIYVDVKDYEKAEEQFLKAYNISNGANSLLALVKVQYHFNDKKTQAKKSILKYINTNSYNFNLCLQLLSFYELDKENEKIIPFLEKMYAQYQHTNEKVSLEKSKNLLIKYLVRNNTTKAVAFLEENNIEGSILLELYKNNKQFDKASLLLDKLYAKSNNPEYLAQQAILEFEMAKNKEEVINSVIAKFEKVLKSNNNAVYQNYLAYILIDYDKDVKKGILLVKKALVLEPRNMAYIDTLAWGEYKVNNCKEAYLQMKKVVDEIGLEEKEIKLHWEKIKECVK